MACELQQRSPVVCLMGPTASGKTALALDLVERHNFEIVSVDSALVFKGMDIGTAKPSLEEQARAPHRLIDLLDPSESYSAADFFKDAQQAIAEIYAAGKRPLLVGGTMMYFKVLRDGIAPLPETDPQIREAVSKEAQVIGWAEMHRKLAEVDPQSAARIHPNDPQRLSRALEIYRVSGRTMTDWLLAGQKGLNESLQFLAIAPSSRELLRKRIRQRFEAMLAMGFEAEVKALKSRDDLHLDLPSMRCVGYRQMWQYLDGHWSYDEMVERGVIATAQLAKRQMTWLRGWESVNWLDSDDCYKLDKVVSQL